MVKTEATSKRKAEDEEAKETLVKVAGRGAGASL